MEHGGVLVGYHVGLCCKVCLSHFFVCKHAHGVLHPIDSVAALLNAKVNDSEPLFSTQSIHHCKLELLCFYDKRRCCVLDAIRRLHAQADTS